MSASATPDPDTTDEILSLDTDTLEDAAELRAEGVSWSEIARKVRWDERRLKRTCRTDTRFAPLVELVRDELRQQDETEALNVMRKGIRSTDAKVRLKAAERLLKHETARRANETRKHVAQIHKQARIEAARLRKEAVIEAAKIKVESARVKQRFDEKESGASQKTPDQAMGELWRDQKEGLQWMLSEMARESVSLFLWGGCHAINENVPPDETDTPLFVMCKNTVPDEKEGLREIFWLVPGWLPVGDPKNGPFLEPPGCRPATAPAKPEGYR